MKITINTDILKKHNLTLGEFLIMLLGYFDIDLQSVQDTIVNKSLADKNLFKEMGIILSNNSKDLIARILMESDDKAIKSGINFEQVAEKMMNCYPSGNKPGKSYSWRSTIEEIAQKLRTIVVKYDFLFTEEEAVNAVREYISSFTPPYKDMLLLRSFILRTSQDEIESLFMTIIENNRE